MLNESSKKSIECCRTKHTVDNYMAVVQLQKTCKISRKRDEVITQDFKSNTLFLNVLLLCIG